MRVFVLTTGRSGSMAPDLADSTEGFPKFCSWIGADGDLEAAVHAFSVGHNAT